MSLTTWSTWGARLLKREERDHPSSFGEGFGLSPQTPAWALVCRLVSRGSATLCPLPAGAGLGQAGEDVAGNENRARAQRGRSG